MNHVKGHSWQDLTRLTGEREFRVERVRIRENGVAIEGDFELPHLARLSAEDQIFVAAFLRAHGSIKEMERVFGVSYPTVKSRLSRIAERIEFVEADSIPTPTPMPVPDTPDPRNPRSEQILDLLASGKITAAEAEQLLHSLAVLTRSPPKKARYLRLIIEGIKGAQGTDEPVNIRVPMQLIQAGVKMSAFMSSAIEKKVDEALQLKGFSFSLRDLAPENLDEMLGALGDLALDGENVPSGARVRIFTE